MTGSRWVAGENSTTAVLVGATFLFVASTIALTNDSTVLGVLLLVLGFAALAAGMWMLVTLLTARQERRR